MRGNPVVASRQSDQSVPPASDYVKEFPFLLHTRSKYLQYPREGEQQK